MGSSACRASALSSVSSVVGVAYLIYRLLAGSPTFAIARPRAQLRPGGRELYLFRRRRG